MTMCEAVTLLLMFWLVIGWAKRLMHNIWVHSKRCVTT